MSAHQSGFSWQQRHAKIHLIIAGRSGLGQLRPVAIPFVMALVDSEQAKTRPVLLPDQKMCRAFARNMWNNVMLWYAVILAHRRR